MTEKLENVWPTVCRTLDRSVKTNEDSCFCYIRQYIRSLHASEHIYLKHGFDSSASECKINYVLNRVLL